MTATLQEETHFVQVETPTTTDESPRLTLEWRSVTLRVRVKNSQTKQEEDKLILNNVSGSAHPGELLVIMGPSGAGKSSLLDVISSQSTAAEGVITVNGAKWTKSLKRFASYVMQDDLFYRTITVREHLVYQARLRMGSTASVEQYAARVDTVLEELGLNKCRDTLIGDATFQRNGISGGERKRLSFATEILTNPSLLFVDEPTSGLDSFMAETVMLQLQQLARGGRTVVATIHQPSSQLYTLFDTLCLLSEGSTVYHGNAERTFDYFAQLGFQCPAFMNPSDYFMRQLVVLDRDKDDAGVQRVELLKDEWAKTQQQQHEQLNGSPASGGQSKLGFTADDENTDSYQDSRIGTLGQMAVISSRNLVHLVRDRIAFQAKVAQNLFIAIVVGLIYLQLELSQTGIQNFAGAFFVIVVNQTFASAAPLFVEIPTELPMVLREYKGGLYHLIVWYLSKNLSELPLQILLPFVLFVPMYFLIGIGQGFATYMALQVLVVLVNFAAVGLGYLVSCLCRRVDIAPIVGIVILLPFMLIGGLFLNASDAPKYFVWIQYISPIKFGFEGLMKVFWREIKSIKCDATRSSCVARSGEEVLEVYSMTGSSAFVDGLGLAFRLVGFFALWMSVRAKK